MMLERLKIMSLDEVGAWSIPQFYCFYFIDYPEPKYDRHTFCLRMVRWFFSGFSGFRPPLMNDRLDISEIFLKGP